MCKEIKVEENGLFVLFRIRENGVVELAEFTAAQAAREKEDIGEEIYPALEVQLTGKSTRGMHGYKHNASSASMDFGYIGHDLYRKQDRTELVISMKTDYDLYADYHMVFFDGIPVVRTWSELKNMGIEEIGLEYVSSFIYQGLAAGGKLSYHEKTDVYLPYNSWCCEAQWRKEDIQALNLSGMPVDGFNMPGFGINRYCYGGRGSWSSCEYLPMGFAEDRETKEMYCFEIEHSGEWLVEYGSGFGSRLYAALSGPAEYENGWWKNLKPGDVFRTVPAAFGTACGDISTAAGVLTRYRRAFRRQHQDSDNLNIVFNDYMNCLMGDPTEEKERQIIDKAAEIGCEYYCMDCGWYDKGMWWDRVGEWEESPERFPGGMKAVCDYARSKGLKMGLWLEIEVMGTACALASRLPDDWFVCRHGKRHVDNKRYLLDFRNPRVREYCMGIIDRLVLEYGVEFFKIDYNVTMGYGSDLDTDSCADAILEHYRCLYGWYEEIFTKYPDLVIENCGSGGMRMDYGLLELLSLQSTSDQTDYIYNSYIAANVASAVAPEQAGMWVYPYKDEEEHVIYNMVNGLLLRPYISGMVWKLGASSMELMKEGVALYKSIRQDVKNALPVFPLGFHGIEDEVMAYGLQTEDTVYLAVFMPKTREAFIPLGFVDKVESVRVIYPNKENCRYGVEDGKLHIRMPEETCARLFELTYKV